MKRIRALSEPTSGLRDYLDCDGEHANWDGFRSHQAGAAYREVIETLGSLQHGLCGYCEIDIKEWDRQVEHVVPQSDPRRGRTLALDPENMIACCKGGTRKTDDDARWQPPARRNRSCGEAKQDLADPDFIDPRMLPALPSLTRIRFDGRMTVDEAACAIAGIDAGRVNRTINILGLNVGRLRQAREKRWRALSDQWREYHDDPKVMKEAARKELLPGEDCRLRPYFTTRRSYFGTPGEEILETELQAWI